jgi:hypothetical protein
MRKPLRQVVKAKNRKRYSKPKLVTHGDVAKLTRKHPHPHRHDRWGPPSDLL